jgi:hypothetical protein
MMRISSPTGNSSMVGVLLVIGTSHMADQNQPQSSKWKQMQQSHYQHLLLTPKAVASAETKLLAVCYNIQIVSAIITSFPKPESHSRWEQQNLAVCYNIQVAYAAITSGTFAETSTTMSAVTSTNSSLL